MDGSFPTLKKKKSFRLRMICEKFSIGLLNSCWSIWRLISYLIVGLCMELLISVVMMIGGRTFQPLCEEWLEYVIIIFSLWDVVVSKNLSL